MYRPGDIILAPFPFTDLSSVKPRPVLVLSSKKYNAMSRDVITCGITSNPHNKKHSFAFSQKDIADGFLPFDSRIKPAKLFIMNQKIIMKRLCTVKPRILKRVRSMLRAILK